MDSSAATTLSSEQTEANAINKRAETGTEALTEAGQQQGQSQSQDKWPGWPGDNVFRLIVPVSKVGSIIGRKGELVKKMCDETRARIRILEGPLGITDRIVLISGKEEPEAPLSPAMDAVLRVFKRVSGLSPGEGDNTGSAAAAAAAGSAFCSIRLLVASSQAINLIGKQGSIIKSIQENTGVVVRVMAEDDIPSYATSDERIVEIHGEAMKVFKALEAVIGHLRKFLVDHSVIPIFEKTYNATISLERPADARADNAQPSLHSAPAFSSGIISDYSLSLKRDPSIYEHETHFEHKISQPGFSLYGDPGLGGLRSTGLGRATAPIVTQVTQTMQVPLSYAEDIIGVAGSNIAYIRRTSGAILSIQESRGLPDEITVEIKGTSSQVQMAQQLIQEFISNHKEPTPNMYGSSRSSLDVGLNAYSQIAESGYPSSSFTSHLGGYGSSSIGGYGSPGAGGAGGYNSYRF
ncbi:RNA-binding KH domain-containing protein PEPPER-like [Populus nigra]|uniref:RNA-binding KH domain-containing protein PEPPER-like n=1 Tax=Populus nigra TaxID=3691 RepID=UPI002B26DE83|nr:RNA-binding KH domain-containing protein PEPPER-like [Populus nigra]